MTTATVTKIETRFSENAALSDRHFSNMFDADVAVMRAVASMDASDRCYYKTDFTITWSDGETLEDRLDANRVTNFSSHLGQIARFYQGSQPEWMTLAEWTASRAAWVKFSKNRAF